MSLASRSSCFAVALVVTAFGLVTACGSDGSTNDQLPPADTDAGNREAGAGTETPNPATDGGSVEVATDAGAEGGLPPGATCVVDADAGKMVSTFCQDNPALPTCFQCVDLTENGELDGVCAYTCRVGKQDCPQGQTCKTGDVAQRTGYQPCRDATDGQQLGYCQ